MSNSYDLTQLDSHSFEHMVNFLGMKVLGNGVTGFAAGPDGGRDGYLKGKAQYPTPQECWEGSWYIQSKFHKPNLSSNAQKWLITQVIDEIKEYSENPRRTLPDIWIIATNIEPSGHPQTGAYDKIKTLVNKFAPSMKVDIWGGRKILDFLIDYPQAAQYYGHFLTPGHLITALHKMLTKSDVKHKALIEYFMVSQFKDLSYTKLEQAGSSNDHKPKIHELFRDLPIRTSHSDGEYSILESLVSASSNVQKITTWVNFGSDWKNWSKNPRRTRIILLKGGPGQGKSTVGQYFSQIQRAAYILSDAVPTVTPPVKGIAVELKTKAESDGFWPNIPRIPIYIELKEYANWFISRDKYLPRNILEYICGKVNIKISVIIDSMILRDALSQLHWFVNFDGLDEVPNDLKDDIANEVITFTNEILPSLDSDALVLCTTRPQGYSGQFDELDASICHLLPLTKDIALSCAEPVVRFGRSEEDGNLSLEILESAMLSPQVKEIMTTPLQSHIMAVVVRDGGRPPEKRWELFNNFYTVMKKRETLKNFTDVKIASLLQEKELLLKAIHDRLGICLHVRSEISQGAEAALPKKEFRDLAKSTTEMLMDGNIEEIVNTLMEATIERLVFVNTPDSTEYVRFDIRQLQEFFAAEFIHNGVSDQALIDRLTIIVGDAHWREVVHFILSALIHYKKKTGLMLVSTLLYQLDLENENHKIKYYNKRSAVGSLFVLRLIEEGLLEQDKRIRSLFNMCLLPLWGNLESEVIGKIIGLKMEQSKNWLLTNMIESFIDMDYNETISCGLLFSVMLDKTHERFNDVFIRLQNMPDDTLLFVLYSAKIEFHHANANYFKPWFIEYLVNKYFSSKTSPLLLTAIYLFLNRIINFTGCGFENLDIPLGYKFFLEEYLEYPKKNDGYDELKDDKYCFVKVMPYEKNWGNCSQFSLKSAALRDDIYSFPIEIFKATDDFYHRKDIQRFRKILELILSHKSHLACCPGALKAIIPVDFNEFVVGTQCDYLMKSSDDELSKYLENKIYNLKQVLPESKYLVFSYNHFSNERWTSLCHDYPELALQVITSSFLEREDIFEEIGDKRKEIFIPILDIAKNHPHAIASNYFLWGPLFEFFPAEFNHIKTLMSEMNPIAKYGALYNPRVSSIYKLSLPQDKGLLVHLAYALTTMKSQMDKLKKMLPGYFADGVLEAFGLSFNELHEIAMDKEESEMVRVACASLLCHHQLSDKNKTIEHFFNMKLDILCIDLYSSEYALLITNSVFNMLHDVANVDYRLKEFLGKYAYISRKSCSCRFSTQQIFSKWRERSNSAVSSANRLPTWLSE
ncbi:NACHT domain-containing protein [Pectobacterium brasiliense]|uniref:NACHT domain-containing protein n=1 Tax=Pectobacterium brasiliense TaxID=180957 RepID=UPI0038739E47